MEDFGEAIRDEAGEGDYGGGEMEIQAMEPVSYTHLERRMISSRSD